MEKKPALRIADDDGDRTVAAPLLVRLELWHDPDRAVMLIDQDDLIEGGIHAWPDPMWPFVWRMYH